MRVSIGDIVHTHIKCIHMWAYNTESTLISTRSSTETDLTKGCQTDIEGIAENR